MSEDRNDGSLARRLARSRWTFLLRDLLAVAATSSSVRSSSSTNTSWRSAETAASKLSSAAASAVRRVGIELGEPAETMLGAQPVELVGAGVTAEVLDRPRRAIRAARAGGRPSTSRRASDDGGASRRPAVEPARPGRGRRAPGRPGGRRTPRRRGPAAPSAGPRSVLEIAHRRHRPPETGGSTATSSLRSDHGRSSAASPLTQIRHVVSTSANAVPVALASRGEHLGHRGVRARRRDRCRRPPWPTRTCARSPQAERTAAHRGSDDTPERRRKAPVAFGARGHREARTAEGQPPAAVRGRGAGRTAALADRADRDRRHRRRRRSRPRAGPRVAVRSR